MGNLKSDKENVESCAYEAGRQNTPDRDPEYSGCNLMRLLQPIGPNDQTFLGGVATSQQDFDLSHVFGDSLQETVLRHDRPHLGP